MPFNNTNGALNQNGCDFIAFIVMELVGLENLYEGLVWRMGAFIDTSLHLPPSPSSSPHISFPSGHSFIYDLLLCATPPYGAIMLFVVLYRFHCKRGTTVLKTFLQKWAMAGNTCSVRVRLEVWLDFPRPRDRPLKNRAVSSHCYNRASLFIFGNTQIARDVVI